MNSNLKLNSNDFTKKTEVNGNLLNNSANIEQLFNLPLPKLISVIKTLDYNSIHILMKNEEVFKNNLNIIILNVNDDIKKEIISKKEYLKAFLLIKPNRSKKIPFDFLSSELKGEILSEFNYINTINENLYQNLVTRLDYNELNEIYSHIDKAKLQLDINFITTYINNNFNISEDLVNQSAYQFMKNNFLILFKIKNDAELIIYSRFDILVDADQDDTNITIDNISISKDIIYKLNSRQIKKLITKLINKEKEMDYNKALITIIKLYCIFGFDYVSKILDDKFSSMTKLAIKKAAEINFTDYRRQYRLENQDLFYSNDMLNIAKQALKNNSIDYFARIFGLPSTDLAYEKMYQIKNNIQNSDSPDTTLINILKNGIENREALLKNNYIINYYNNYITNIGINNNRIYLPTLFDKFKDLDISKAKLDDDGRPILDNYLNDFIFGNYKANNDCLLRLVLNNEALGLNNTLSSVIDNFTKIKKIIDKSNGKLSIDSILDVIDVFKVLFYKLEPNEQDMTLATISKIMRSMEYCTEPKEVIFKRARKLHIERRRKCYSSIPTVSGTTNDVSYKVMNFDDDSLIALGIDTGCCFKVGGKGEDFLSYCLTNPNAVIVELNCKGTKYICPFIRNGNGIYGNGIDPRPENNDIAMHLLNALQDCCNNIIKQSDNNEKIHFATITNLHQEEFFDTQTYQRININTYLPIGGIFYSDYDKKELKNYIITSIDDKINPVFYIPKIRYYQERKENYIYNPNVDIDKERIALQINSINYDAIDCMNISTKEKNSLKRKYVSLNVDDYDLIIGNKDWFIAVNEYNLMSRCLPYDKRARSEYYDTLINIQNNYKSNKVVKK